MGLGDMIGRALAAVGVTPEWVEKLLGRPCGCQERREKLNAISSWARRILAGKVEKG